MKKLAGISFNDKEAEEIKNNFFKGEEYIIRYKTIYQLFYSVNAGIYAQKIYQAPATQGVGFTLKGRFIIANASFVNRLIGFNLLNV